jgi:magnesium transporter
LFKGYRIQDGRVVEDTSDQPQVLVAVSPTDDEKRVLITHFGLDEHTLNSSVDPDELSRFEIEPEHVAIIYKRPQNYMGGDQLQFKTSSGGLFLFKERLIIVLSDQISLFVGKQFNKVSSLNDLALKMLYMAISHFLEHLKGINMITGDLEAKINASVENRYLIQLFSLEKSLVYYLNAITTNGVLIERVKLATAKVGLTQDEVEFLDDMAIENSQCLKQSEIHANVLASLMDARASIVSNNLNVLMKTLNLITICIMVPTLVVSAFSMNVTLPMNLQDHPYAFWIIMGFATLSLIVTVSWWFSRKNR